MASSTPFPGLPSDVVRLLIEAVGESDLQTALTLALCCKHYRHWVYPTIYRSVNLKSIRSLDRFLNTLHSNPSCRSLVRFLTIDTLPGFYCSKASDSAMCIISLCTSAISIALWSLKGSHQLVDFTNHKCLRRISVHMECFMADTPLQPRNVLEIIPSFMYNLTHLDLYEFKEKAVQRAAILPYLHKLTHLFMVSASDEALPLVSHFTSYLPPSLKVWIVHFRHYRSNDRHILSRLVNGKVEPRLVISMKTIDVVQDLPYAEYIIARALAQSAKKNAIWREWGFPLDRGLDFWEEAEDVIAKRKASQNSPAKPSDRALEPSAWVELYW